jgi:hypothetical protein
VKLVHRPFRQTAQELLAGIDPGQHTLRALIILGVERHGGNVADQAHEVWRLILADQLDDPIHHELCQLALRQHAGWQLVCRAQRLEFPRTWRDVIAAGTPRPPELQGPITSARWAAVCGYYLCRCVACGSRNRLTMDHIEPDGDRDDIANIQPLCQSCNSRKCRDMRDYRPGGSDDAYGTGRSARGPRR